MEITAYSLMALIEAYRFAPNPIKRAVIRDELQRRLKALEEIVANSSGIALLEGAGDAS